MLLAALVDAAGERDILSQVKDSLMTIPDIHGEWDVLQSKVMRSEGLISATHIKVISKFNHEPLPPPGAGAHDHSHSHGHEHSHAHEDSADNDSNRAATSESEHDHQHGHCHGHANSDDGGHEHSHSHTRGLTAIANMVHASGMPDIVKTQAVSVFTELATAESRVHGTTQDKVHFHEVGAIDSIVDTCGVLLALHFLGVSTVYCSAVPLGQGTVWTAHGLLPVPAPATAQLLRGFNMVPGPPTVKGELVTPTGASLLRVLCGFPILGSTADKTNSESDSGIAVSVRQGGPPPGDFRIASIGMGAGTKNFPKHPNIVRVMLGTLGAPLGQRQGQGQSKVANTNANRGKSESAIDSKSNLNQEEKIPDITNRVPTLLKQTPVSVSLSKSEEGEGQGEIKLWEEEDMVIIEANIDDQTPEILSNVCSRLLSLGARDVWSEGIGMKKGRNATKLSVLCTPVEKGSLLTALFSESSTIGARIIPIQRAFLRREIISLKTPYGDVSAKASYLGDKIVTVKPEYDDCKALSEKANVPLKKILGYASSAAMGI